jgi:hypothetical protein
MISEKMKKLLVLIPALLVISSTLFSQNKFSVNFYGGYTLPVSDLHGTFPDTLGSTQLDFTKSKTLLTTYGINAGIQGTFAVDSAGSQILTAGFNYNSFTGSKDYSTPNLGLQTYKNKVSIITLSAGIEYAINPANKIVPFIGLEFAANFYGGKIEGTGDSLFTLNRKNETRLGVIANGGAVLKLWKWGGIIAGVRYALTNLIGKKSEIQQTTFEIADAEQQGGTIGSELPLNDEDISTSPGKVLNYVQFYLGISYSFGKKLGKKK